jgi:transcriptional regulator with XRE-family HTH domain
MDLNNKQQLYGEKVRKFYLASFALKVKLGILNSAVMTNQLENLIKNFANSTAENFARDLKKYEETISGEAISGETIRNIISKVKHDRLYVISNERTRLFLKLFNILAEKAIEQGNFSLKNTLLLNFYTYPGDDELKVYIDTNNLSDSYTPDSLLEHIISKHNEISKNIYEKYQPRLIARYLNGAGRIFKKDEWTERYSNNLFEQQSIVNDEDFDAKYLPRDVGSICTGIGDNVINFMSKNIRFLRLVSRDSKTEDFAKELGIEKTSLIQYEKNREKFKLNDSMICKLVDYYSKEQDIKQRALFDYFFTEISCPKFTHDLELRRRFSELLDDYTFLKYTKFLHDNPEENTETVKKTERKTVRKTVRADVRQESIDLLECELRWFVLQTILDKNEPFLEKVEKSLYKLD